MSVRISRLASELGIRNRDMLEWLSDHGERAAGPWECVDDDVAAAVRATPDGWERQRALHSHAESEGLAEARRMLMQQPVPVVLATIQALLSAAETLIAASSDGRGRLDSEPMSLLELLRSDVDRGWDVFLNEAEGLYQEEPEAPFTRDLIEATWDPAMRVALAQWENENRGLIADPSLRPRAIVAASQLDLEEYAVAAELIPDLAGGRLPCDVKLINAAPETALDVLKFWRLTSTSSPLYRQHPQNVQGFENAPRTSETSAPPAHGGDGATAQGAAGSPRQSPVATGELLEASVFDVFETVFALEPQLSDQLRSQVRRQNAGLQFGTDIIFRARSQNSDSVCLIECKNYASPISVGEIGGKLLQAQANYNAEPVDHFILISPHSNPNNELDTLLQQWQSTRAFPFTVQVWSPQSSVDHLFAMVPEVYEALYGRAPSLDQSRRQEALREFTQRLLPPIRLPDRLASFVNAGERNTSGSEEAGWLAQMDNSVQRRGLDAAREPLKTSLETAIVAVLKATPGRTAILWADFGEGKSFFGVQLCEVLRRRFVAQPEATSLIPIRMLLKGYRSISSASDFLRTQLERMGLSMEDLHTLRRDWSPVLILDGMDEMSAGQDLATVKQNMHKLDELLQLLDGSPVLITSRPQFLRSAKDRERLFDRLRNPVEFHLAQPDRQSTVAHLREFAIQHGLNEKFNRIKDLYDPIGLAGKMLFLAMLKETLGDLPDDQFNEEILYRTYVAKALRRKVDLLQDSDAESTHGELIERLTLLLERVAVAIHKSADNWVDLHEFLGDAGGPAELLWNAAADDPALDDDAATRIGGRSLLRRVRMSHDPDVWAVDFFHRSMKEHFVASHLIRRLTSSDPFEQTRTLLRDLPIDIAVANFFRLQAQRAPEVLPVLESLLRSASVSARQQARLGAGAASLYAAAGGSFAGADWRALDMEGALLGGQDFSGADLKQVSLRGADLTSSCLDRADLRGADLSNANLDLGEEVVGLAAAGPHEFVAVTSESRLVAIRTHLSELVAESIQLDPLGVQTPRQVGLLRGGLVAVLGRGAVALVDMEGEARIIATFLVDNAILSIRALEHDRLLILTEEPSGVQALIRDLNTGEVLASTSLSADAVFVNAGETRMSWVAGDGMVRQCHWDGEPVLAFQPAFPVALLAEGRDGNEPILIGSVEGHVSVGEFPPVRPHEGRVTALAESTNTILSAGMDGALAVSRRSNGGAPTLIARLPRRLRCELALVDHDTSLLERELLLANGATMPTS